MNELKIVKGKRMAGPEGTVPILFNFRFWKLGPPLSTIYQKEKGTAIRKNQGCHLAAEEHRISQLFRSYFNNKMTLLFFLIQGENTRYSPKLVESANRFLEDVYHHMLSPETQNEHRLIFKWLNVFFRKFPDVSDNQREKAKSFALCVYDAMGFYLKADA